MRKKLSDKKSVVKFEEDIDMVIEELEVEVCEDKGDEVDMMAIENLEADTVDNQEDDSSTDIFEELEVEITEDKEAEAGMEVIENLEIDAVDNQEDDSSTDIFEELEVEITEDKEAEAGMEVIENLEIDAVDNQEDDTIIDIFDEHEVEATEAINDKDTVDLSQNKIAEPMLRNYLTTGDITKQNHDDVSLINQAFENAIPIFDEYSSVDSQSISRVIGSAGIMSIINSLKNGKRLSFCRDLMLKLKLPERVQIGTNSNSIIIGVKLPFKCNDFKISKTGGKSIIYSGPLVMEITKKFNLDYSNRTSITFHDVTYGEFEGFPYAIIKIINDGEI
ncbi:hypothetical protein [Geosporobacter ferrireducens]|uniref:Uncharacterized protein n=1 Tax=Geosporobacter ferrireducens TaxID=1424294 RepID=A0A1D8GPB9_9FIRM|nr:hypothetical protein [Geosporobacter ferrireducens]AOT72806.1 hypothetical protein Gferi_26555 [Geosporobacter ferrireducens]